MIRISPKPREFLQNWGPPSHQTLPLFVYIVFRLRTQSLRPWVKWTLHWMHCSFLVLTGNPVVLEPKLAFGQLDGTQKTIWGIIDQPGEERAVPESFTLFYSFRAPRLVQLESGVPPRNADRWSREPVWWPRATTDSMVSLSLTSACHDYAIGTVHFRIFQILSDHVNVGLSENGGCTQSWWWYTHYHHHCPIFSLWFGHFPHDWPL